MKMVTNETELRNALKERAPEITIVTFGKPFLHRWCDLQSDIF